MRRNIIPAWWVYVEERRGSRTVYFYKSCVQAQCCFCRQKRLNDAKFPSSKFNLKSLKNDWLMANLVERWQLTRVRDHISPCRGICTWWSSKTCDSFSEFLSCTCCILRHQVTGQHNTWHTKSPWYVIKFFGNRPKLLLFWHRWCCDKTTFHKRFATCHLPS